MNAMQLIQSQRTEFELAGLKPAVKQEVLLWLDFCLRIEGADNKGLTITEIAREMLGADGFGESTIRRKYDKWRHAGRDWRALVDGRKIKRRKPNELIAEVYKYYCEKNQRSSRAAHRRLMEDMRAGRELPPMQITWVDLWRAEHPDRIPPRECPGDYIPDGCTYRTLQRKYGLGKYEAKAMRIGRAAAREFIPAVLTTRVGLKPGEIYMFDDVWHDIDTFYGAQVCRPMEFACLDVASGCKVHYGLKPRITEEDGTRRNLNERDMRFLLAYVLCNIGYRATGTWLIAEHGTAAVRDALQQILLAITNNAVKVILSSMLNEQVHAGLFAGTTGGNFRLKAALESSHNLLHIEGAHLPAQVGSNGRTARVESIDKLEHYTKTILKAATELSPERRQMLCFEMLEYNRYARVYDELSYRINARTWHELEGWEEAGYMIEEFRVSDQADNWLPMSMLLEMDQVQADAIRALIRTDPKRFARPRRLSPLEVWERGRGDLVQVSKHHVPDILGPKLALPKPITARKDGRLVFERKELGPGEHIFPATVTTPSGFTQSLTPGVKYMIHCSPLDPDEVFITDQASGEYIGFATRLYKPCKTDFEGIAEMAGQQIAAENKLMKPIRKRHAHEVAAHQAMLEHNDQVLKGDIDTPSELIRRERVDAQDEVDEEDFAAAMAVARPEHDEELSADEIYGILRED